MPAYLYYLRRHRCPPLFSTLLSLLPVTNQSLEKHLVFSLHIQNVLDMEYFGQKELKFYTTFHSIKRQSFKRHVLFVCCYSFCARIYLIFQIRQILDKSKRELLLVIFGALEVSPSKSSVVKKKSLRNNTISTSLQNQIVSSTTCLLTL